MSFEILEGGGYSSTVYAPLNTTIDADRDYRDLMGLDACACGGGMPPRMIPPGSAPQLSGFGCLCGGEPCPCPPQPSDLGCLCEGKPCPCPSQLNGFYQDNALTPGMLGESDVAEGGGKGMLMLMGGLLGAWVLWAWFTPHQEYRG